MLSFLFPHLNADRKSTSRVRIRHTGGIGKCFQVLSGVKGLTVKKRLEKLTKIMLKIISEVLEAEEGERTG